MNKITGKYLNDKWGVNARHALYRENGSWYHLLERFPGALFDANGYIMFETKRDYEGCHYLNIGQELNVPGGIASIPGYVRMRNSN
jgi:hypothetical protein